MIDTHTHIYMPDSFPGSEAEEAVQAAIEAGVHTMLFPNIDRASVESLLTLCHKHPGTIYAAMGLHPTEVTESWRSDLEYIKNFVSDPAVVAIGEIGLDLHWDTSTLPLQIQALEAQIGWAREYSLPIIIHQRDALSQTLDTLSGQDLSAIPGIVFHCFTDGPEVAQTIMERIPSAMFGIGGVSTFKNARALREALHVIGAERIVLETDSPYLAPTPHRGSRNSSAYIPLILSAVSAELGIPAQELEAITDSNARRLFPKIKQI